MNTQNLMPTKRIALKTRQRSVRRWSMIDVGYAAALALIGAAYVHFATSSLEHVNVAQVRSQIEQANASVTALKHSAAALKAVAESDRQLSNSPNWSILLSAISNCLGDELVLNRIDCMGDRTDQRGNPAGESGSAKSVESVLQQVPGQFRIGGVGRSQQAVAGFVLKLEELNFFSKVRLVHTGPTAVAGLDGIAFDLQCDLAGRGRTP